VGREAVWDRTLLRGWLAYTRRMYSFVSPTIGTDSKTVVVIVVYSFRLRITFRQEELRDKDGYPAHCKLGPYEAIQECGSSRHDDVEFQPVSG